MKFIDYDSGKYQGRPVEYEIVGTCHIVVSHAPNQDGYIRKCFTTNGVKKLKMYHRFVWERVNGEIPEGYEVDHKCRQRACCNIDHLQILTVSEHKAKTNRERTGIKLVRRRRQETD